MLLCNSVVLATFKSTLHTYCFVQWQGPVCFSLSLCVLTLSLFLSVCSLINVLIHSLIHLFSLSLCSFFYIIICLTLSSMHFSSISVSVSASVCLSLCAVPNSVSFFSLSALSFIQSMIHFLSISLCPFVMSVCLSVCWTLILTIYPFLSLPMSVCLSVPNSVSFTLCLLSH